MYMYVYVYMYMYMYMYMYVYTRAWLSPVCHLYKNFCFRQRISRDPHATCMSANQHIL